MVFFLVTVLVSGAIIYFLASALEWILSKVAPGLLVSLGPVGTAVLTVAVVTALYLFVMTRPAVVGPYEQWTFENIGGQVIGGVLVAGIKVWQARKAEATAPAATV